MWWSTDNVNTSNPIGSSVQSSKQVIFFFFIWTEGNLLLFAWWGGGRGGGRRRRRWRVREQILETVKALRFAVGYPPPGSVTIFPHVQTKSVQQSHLFFVPVFTNFYTWVGEKLSLLYRPRKGVQRADVFGFFFIVVRVSLDLTVIWNISLLLRRINFKLFL